jgi:ABC-type transport system substrate-binding protein
MKKLLFLLLFTVLPVQATTLRWAAQNDILTFDPHSQNHTTTITLVMHVYESLTQVRGLTRAEVLDGGAVLPGFRLPLAELFPEA